MFRCKRFWIRAFTTNVCCLSGQGHFACDRPYRGPGFGWGKRVIRIFHCRITKAYCFARFSLYKFWLLLYNHWSFEHGVKWHKGIDKIGFVFQSLIILNYNYFALCRSSTSSDLDYSVLSRWSASGLFRWILTFHFSWQDLDNEPWILALAVGSMLFLCYLFIILIRLLFPCSSAASIHVLPRQRQSCWNEARGCKRSHEGSTMKLAGKRKDGGCVWI